MIFSFILLANTPKIRYKAPVFYPIPFSKSEHIYETGSGANGRLN